MRMKNLILSIFGKASLNELQEISSIEKSDKENEDVWNYSLATLIGKF